MERTFVRGVLSGWLVSAVAFIVGMIAIPTNCGGGGIGDLIVQVAGISGSILGGVVGGISARPRNAVHVIGGVIFGAAGAALPLLGFLFLALVVLLPLCAT